MMPGEAMAKGGPSGFLARARQMWPPPVRWTRRAVVTLVVAAVVVGFVGRHGGAVLTSFGLGVAAVALGLLAMPDGDPESE